MRIEYNVAQELSTKAMAIHNCQKSGHKEWEQIHADDIKWLIEQFMPSGSGFDSGTKMDITQSNDKRLQFYTSFHHINENGMYDGWTEHSVVVAATFQGFDINISGRNKNDIKEFILDCFANSLGRICHVMDGEHGLNEHGWYFDKEWHKREGV